MAQGSALRYEVEEGWEQLPSGYVHRDVAGVATDSEDRVYLICRGDHPIIVYDANGKFLRSWGQGEFTYRTHGITVGPDEMLYCTDDGNHTVRKFTPDGKLLMTMGTMNKPSDTGYDGKDTGTVSRAAGPFNRPTNLAVGPKGDLYISDGYGNCRVHQFSPRGELKRSWGTPGGGPGEFFLPHGISVAEDGRVFVCDRENDRIQIFNPDGEYLSEWTDTQRPTHPRLRQARTRLRVGALVAQGPDLAAQRADPRVQVRPGQRLRQGRPGPRPLGHAHAEAPGSFAAPHGLAVDSRGAIYVAEVTHTFAVSRGHAREDCHTFQKFNPKP
jgi:Gluconolactonase